MGSASSHFSVYLVSRRKEESLVKAVSGKITVGRAKIGW